MASAAHGSGSRRTRADSLRNRALLLDAARKAFVESGDRASLEAIARTAGLGIGTLYRHFPTRAVLTAAVYESELESATATELVDGLLAKHPTAAAALRSWMDHYAEFVAAKHGMSDALRAQMAGDVASGRTRQRINATVEQFLSSGERDGSLRSDLSADLVTTALVGVLWSVDRTGGEQKAEQVRQLLDLVHDGLTTTASGDC